MGNVEKIAAKKLFWVAPLSGVIAAVINSILYFIGSATGLMDAAVKIPSANASITLFPVLMSSVIPTLLAGLVLAGLNFFLNRPWPVFRVVALVLLVLSFANPFLAIPQIPVGMGIWLNLMHVVVAGVVLYCFGRFTRR